MSSRKKLSTIFDDDFEVTYEEEPSVFTDDYHTDASRQRQFEEVEYDEYDKYDDTPIVRRKRRDHSLVPLAAPIRKGGKALSKFSSALIRQLSVILILSIMCFAAYNFWRGSALYGDIVEAFETMEISPVLAAYFSVVAVFLLFELLSLLWAMTRTRVRNGFTSWKEDTGRGMFSFIAVFVSSYLAFLLNRFIPESPEVLYGLKGALDVYGSLHNVLFGLCAAGVISCLIRKYKSNA
ncbi:MAG: hypothetical protein KHY31_06735 [Clostridiales bacterium]|nr:hypothetical protein [Clostridiales bacterium]